MFSSHVMELVERLCDAVGVISAGRVVASGPLAVVRGDRSLEDVFVELVGAGGREEKNLSWLGSSPR